MLRLTIHASEVATPLGPMRLLTRSGVLLALDFAAPTAEPALTAPPPPAADPRGDSVAAWADPRVPARLERALGRFTLAASEPPRAISQPLGAYFAGELDALDAIPIELAGTPFQRHVWQALTRLPPGATTTYAELARALGAPRALRAVGAANGANPIAIVVPCHRVIASDGTLRAYGGGLERKRWLLEHERRTA